MVAASAVLVVIRVFVPLRMSEELMVGDGAVHGEVACSMVQGSNGVVNRVSQNDMENQNP